MPVIFFDIGDTLASTIPSNDGHFTGFDVFPEALSALESLKLLGLEMGIISNRGNIAAKVVNDALKACNLYDFFNPKYIIYKKKDSAKAFSSAAKTSGLKPDQCIFVGENSQERAFALQGGFLRVVSHPRLVVDVLDEI